MNEVSACIIVKNEENGLEACLKSIRPYVNEIVVVDTGSTDKSLEIAKKYADKVETYLECNDAQGDIMDFSMARNKSFGLATNEIVMWADADDVVSGLENLGKHVERLLSETVPVYVQFPYEYSYDGNGKCTMVHYRERLFLKPNAFHWVNAVHEVFMSKPGITAVAYTGDDIIWKHQRQYIEKTVKPNRNLSILQTWMDKNGEDKDARQLYYIGLEYGNSGNVERSRYFLEKYLLRSGWDDEKYMALLRLIVYSMAEEKYDEVIDYSLRAIKIKPEWAEAYFEAAKACYLLANQGRDEANNWNKCVHFARIGLSLPTTKTVLFVNPLERDVIIHRYLNFALNKIGDVANALDSVNAGLKADPNDKTLLSNKAIYEKEIGKQSLIKAVNALKGMNALNDEQEKAIYQTLNNEQVSLEWKAYNRPAAYPKVEYKDFPVPVITPHSQAWGIPETFVYDDLPMMMTTNQLKALTVAVWKEYMLHDELMSAISFLENAPTRVRHHVEIEDILAKTKKMTEWIKNDEEYSKFNTPIDENEEPFTTEMVPLEYGLSSEAQTRLNLLKDRTEGGEKTLIDWGCNDGFITNRLALARKHKQIVGVDGSDISIDVANTAAKKHNTGAEYVYSFFNEIGDKLDSYGDKGLFDYATTGDVIEHLKDPVNDLLIPMRNHLKEDGKLVLTCPHQALFQGKFVQWADPWKIAHTKNKNWLDTPRRNHIIAPTVWSIKDKLEQAGFYVSGCYRFAFPEPFVEGHSQLVAEAYKKFPEGYDKGKKIVFGIGNGLEEWTPNSVDLTGIGGSEQMAILAAKSLALLGNKVNVYNSCGYLGEGVYDGVKYRVSEKMKDIECDIFIASRYAHMFDASRNIRAKKNILWVHDIIPYNLTEEVYNKIDLIMVLSDWHKENVKSHFPFIKDDKILITSNGLDMRYFDVEERRNQYKAISCSSPDRYLPALLKAVPEIKRRVPKAEFHIFYSFFNWEEFAKLNNDHVQLNQIADLKEQIRRAEPFGVKYHGRASQYQLGKEFASAGVWLYPTWFSETSCISAMDAQAAGALMITSPIAALMETIGDRGIMIPGDPMSDEYQRKFIDATVSSMIDPSDQKRGEIRQYAREHFDVSRVVGKWNEIFDKMLGIE